MHTVRVAQTPPTPRSGNDEDLFVDCRENLDAPPPGPPAALQLLSKEWLIEVDAFGGGERWLEWKRQEQGHIAAWQDGESCKPFVGGCKGGAYSKNPPPCSHQRDSDQDSASDNDWQQPNSLPPAATSDCSDWPSTFKGRGRSFAKIISNAEGKTENKALPILPGVGLRRWVAHLELVL